MNPSQPPQPPQLAPASSQPTPSHRGGYHPPASPLQNASPPSERLRSLIVICACSLIIGGFALANLLTPNPTILASERRRPTELAALTPENLLSTRWMSSCETHAADTFVLREPLRSLRAFTLLDLWHLADKDGLYQGTAGAGKLDPLNTEAVTQSAQKIAYIATDLAKHTPNLHFYYAIIPDKSTYDGHQAVGFNVEQAELLLAPTLPHLTGLSLTDALEANDFYRTDLHWDQSALVREHGVLEALQEGMGFSTPAYPGYEYREAGSFEGVYPGQLALPFAPDVMSYLTNPTIEGLSARYLDLASDRLVAGPIYDLEAFAARDPYDLFCRGAQPLVVFENPEASGERELYVFRDSYGSSLGPLLAQGYSRVTLIDLRYVDYRVLERYVSFAPGSDVLFCYSSQILNNPTVLLVQ